MRYWIAVIALLTSVGVNAEPDCVLPTEVRSVLDDFLSARSKYAFSGTLLLEQGNQRQFVTTTSQPGAMVSVRRMNSQADSAPTSFGMSTWPHGIDACDIGVSYRISLENGANVAGRTTWRLVVRPRDTMRFGYLMDLDRDSGLPLRAVTIAADGQWVERYEFATIDVVPVARSPESDVRPSSPATSGFSLAALPPGFVISEVATAPQQLVVSDGLASASVFLEPMPDGLGAGEGTLRHGSTVTYTRGVREAGRVYLVTVIGEVPVTTARLLATAVRAVAGG